VAGRNGDDGRSVGDPHPSALTTFRPRRKRVAMLLELDEGFPLRTYRLEANYTAARLAAIEETRHLAKDFEEAADKFTLLEQEEARLEVQEIETQAMVETADDAWDDEMHAFERRLLELAQGSTDNPLYRKYFTDIPSHVTTLSYHAEIMISKDLERVLEHEDLEDLRVFVERLRSKREPLENVLVERTRLEVEEARFANRVSLAKTILNKMRRTTLATLEDLAVARGRGRDWAVRFFHSHNVALSAIDTDGAETTPSRIHANGEAVSGERAEA
jgi:hypothetical protein